MQSGKSWISTQHANMKIEKKMIEKENGYKTCCNSLQQRLAVEIKTCAMNYSTFAMCKQEGNACAQLWHFHWNVLSRSSTNFLNYKYYGHFRQCLAEAEEYAEILNSFGSNYSSS